MSPSPTYDMCPVSTKILEACKVKGSKLYHYKGSYTLVTYDWFTDCDGVIWVTCFRQESCDNTYKFADGAFLRLNRDRVDINRDEIVYESFYKSNHLLIFSLDRLLEKNEEGTFKLTLDKVDVKFTPIVIDHLTPNTKVTDQSSQPKTSIHSLMS
jgi:hypothetical protein